MSLGNTVTEEATRSILEEAKENMAGEARGPVLKRGRFIVDTNLNTKIVLNTNTKLKF